jgi:hypothetical protein
MFEILILMDSREKKKILTQSLDVEDKKYRTTLYGNISKKITVYVKMRTKNWKI